MRYILVLSLMAAGCAKSTHTTQEPEAPTHGIEISHKLPNDQIGGSMEFKMEINASNFTIVGKGSDIESLIDGAKVYNGDVEIPLTEEHLKLIADWYVDHAPEYNGGIYVDPDRSYQSFVDSKNDK